jgi:DNA-binding MarR family transcriptional regulator
MVENNNFKAVNMLISTNRMHKRLIDSSVSDKVGLHRTQHVILMHLSKKDRLPSQKELAEHLNITPAAITSALKKLESGGYISRSMGDDNRFNEILITELGRRVVEESKAVFAKIDESMFLGFSNEELKILISYLERMQNNMTDIGGKI